MFGLGHRNTSYAFLAAAVFLTAAGSEYHIYAAICAGISLFMAYLKINDLEKEMDRTWNNHDINEREKMFAEEVREIRREIGNLHERIPSK